MFKNLLPGWMVSEIFLGSASFKISSDFRFITFVHLFSLKQLSCMYDSLDQQVRRYRLTPTFSVQGRIASPMKVRAGSRKAIELNIFLHGKMIILIMTF